MSFQERIGLAPGYEISRVIRGGWQLAGGHGPVDHDRLDDDLLAGYDAGLTVLDCADIYTGVEARLGAFRAAVAARHGAGRLANMKIHTKFVPDLEVLPRIDRAYVRAIVDRSLSRLRMERLDLAQFHWWDYAHPRWTEAALWLGELRDEGKIDLIGATNFDTAHLEALVAAGVPLRAMQVQYSLLDRRPAKAMAEACDRLGVKLLCYGSLAGGFLGERWLGRPAPEGLENRSLIKYRLVIDEFGGWDLFQELLAALDAVARKHGVTIAAVAARWVLDQPAVGAVIIGTRGGGRIDQTLAIGALSLDDDDRRAIARLLAGARALPGDVYDLERDRDGPHAAIMKYNLNRS